MALPLARIDCGVFQKTIFLSSSGHVKKTVSLDTSVSKSGTSRPESGSKTLTLFFASFCVADFLRRRQIFLSKSTSSFSWQQSFKKFRTFLVSFDFRRRFKSSAMQRKNTNSSALVSGFNSLESLEARSKQPKLGSRARILPEGERTENASRAGLEPMTGATAKN